MVRTTASRLNRLFPRAALSLSACAIVVLVAGQANDRSAAPAAAHPGSDPHAHLELLTPQNSVLVMIDHQPQMLFGVFSHERQLLRNNVVGLAKSAKAFGVPTILTTVAAETFSGPILPELRAVFPDQKIYDRTSMNTWDDKGVVSAIAQSGRKKLLIAGLWTEVCVNMPTLEALREGYEVYVVTDACGGTSKEAHDEAMRRMVQAGAVPVTWQQVMLEWQRDWARQETYEAVTNVAKEHGGAYGVGIHYAYSMFGAKEGGHKTDGGK